MVRKEVVAISNPTANDKSSFCTRSTDELLLGPSEALVLLYEQLFSRFPFDDTVSARFHGRQLSRLKMAAFIISCVLTLGLTYLLSRWSARFRAAAITRRSPLARSTHVLVISSCGHAELVPVEVMPLSFPQKVIFSRFAAAHEELHGADLVISEAHAEQHEMRLVNYRCNRFVQNPTTGKLIPITDWKLTPHRSLKEVFGGISHDLYIRQQALFGHNAIHVMQKTNWQLVIEIILHPFTVFQIFCITVWTFEGYTIYAVVLFLLTMGSSVLTVVEMRRNLKRMEAMMRFACPVTVQRRENVWEHCSSEDLVPGDIVVMEDTHMDAVPFDGLLLQGEIILDESMLTGESTPVAKKSMSAANFASVLQAVSSDRCRGLEMHSRHAVFASTKLIRARSGNNQPVLVLVIGTGFLTAKGELVQSIIFPRPNNFRFYHDTLLMIGGMVAIAVAGFCVAIIFLIRFKASPSFIILRGLDLFTIVIPPAIHTVMSIGTIFALNRLKMHNIFCINPPKINVCSRLDLLCFDKTGTLTEDGLDVRGVLPVHNGGFVSSLAECVEDLQNQRENNNSSPYHNSINHSSEPNETSITTTSNMISLLASCHSVQSVRGSLIGDPLDIRMFEYSRWELEEQPQPFATKRPGKNAAAAAPTTVRLIPPAGQAELAEINILRCFEFSSVLRRMSVLTRVEINDSCDGTVDDAGRETRSVHVIHTKGSPECMRKICLASSLPSDYDKVLAEYAYQGFRVIACASKYFYPEVEGRVAEFKPDEHNNGDNDDDDALIASVAREAVECDLVFTGFIIFGNKVKPESAPVIKKLASRKITSVMATGDNILTAICVGRECGFIPQDACVYMSHKVDPRTVSWECVGRGDSVAETPELDISTFRLKGRRDYPKPADKIYLACTGEVLEYYLEQDRELLSDSNDGEGKTWSLLLSQCCIYARMSPQQKQTLVELYQRMGRNVGFCGDGANDCSALRAADVGISLSQAEASVAAPFTSKVTNITCIISLIREGRASLVTSFCCFKFMAAYSNIQSTSLILLYLSISSFGNSQFVYIDLVCVLPFALLMARFKTAKELVHEAPPVRLISTPVLLSLGGQAVLQAAFQGFILYMSKHVSEYVNISFAAKSGDVHIECFENTFLFFHSIFMYMAIAFSFCAGKPYRQAFYWPFYAWMAIVAVLNTGVLFVPAYASQSQPGYLPYIGSWLNYILDLKSISMKNRWFIAISATCHFVLTVLFQSVVCPVIINAVRTGKDGKRRSKENKIHNC